MTSVFFQGKYRQRKDWSTSSIPELVSLEEEASHVLPEIPTTLPPKAPRRSSLAIGLLAGGRGGSDPKSKRRSSIATAFLGRQNKVILIYSSHVFNFFLYSILFLFTHFFLLSFVYFGSFFLVFFFHLYTTNWNGRFIEISCKTEQRCVVWNGSGQWKTWFKGAK